MSLFVWILIVTAMAVALGLWAWRIDEGSGRYGGTVDRDLERAERDLRDRMAVGAEEWLP